MVSIDELLEQANNLEKNQKFEEALRILNDLSLADPENQTISLKVSELLFSYGIYLNDEFVTEYDKAIECFKKLVDLDQSSYRALYNLGLAHYNKGDYTEALKMFNAAIDLKPNYKYCLYNIGLTYETMKQYKKALSFYKKALEVDENFRYALHAKEQIKRVLKLENQWDDEAGANSFFKSEKLEQKFVDLIKMSNRLEISTLQKLMEVEAVELYDFLMKLGEKGFIRIDGNFVNIDQNMIEDLIRYTQKV